MSAVNISSQAFAELSAQIFENASRLKSRNAGKYADTAADNDIIAESLRQNEISGAGKEYAANRFPCIIMPRPTSGRMLFTASTVLMLFKPPRELNNMPERYITRQSTSMKNLKSFWIFAQKQ